MNLHEYQGKQILNSFGVNIQRGIVASTADEAVAAAKKLTENTGNVDELRGLRHVQRMD